MAAPQIINIGGTAYVSASDAARMSGFSQTYITRLARNERLASHRLGRNWFIALAALRTLTDPARATRQ
jgi:hypothetical protein